MQIIFKNSVSKENPLFSVTETMINTVMKIIVNTKYRQVRCVGEIQSVLMLQKVDMHSICLANRDKKIVRICFYVTSYSLRLINLFRRETNIFFSDSFFQILSICFRSESLSQNDYEIFKITSQFHLHFIEAKQGGEVFFFFVDSFKSVSGLLFVAPVYLFLL
jgi:hypothetical protein